MLPWRLSQAAFRKLLWRMEEWGLVLPEQGAAFRGTRLLAEEAEQALRGANLRTLRMIQTQTTYRFCDSVVYYCEREA